MKGDYYRYLAEVASVDDKKGKSSLSLTPGARLCPGHTQYVSGNEVVHMEQFNLHTLLWSSKIHFILLI